MKRTFEWNEGAGPLDVVHRHSARPGADVAWLVISALLAAVLLHMAAHPAPVAATPQSSEPEAVAAAPRAP